MKTIPGSNPPMYIEENGAVRSEHFQKIAPELDEEQNRYFTKVAGKKRFIDEIMLEVYSKEPVRVGEGMKVKYLDGDNTNFERGNLQVTTKSNKDTDTGKLKEVPEAGSVKSEVVEGKDEEEKEQIKKDAKPQGEAPTKKELIIAALKGNPDKSDSDIAGVIKKDHGVKVSLPYVASVRKDLE